MEDEEVVPAVRREHLQGTVPQEVSPLVDLSYCVIWPLDTANERVRTYECVGRGGGGGGGGGGGREERVGGGGGGGGDFTLQHRL